jgi:hypothetical protein
MAARTWRALARGRTFRLAAALPLLWAGTAACGDSASAPGSGPVTYELLYVDDAPLPATIASGMGFAEELVGGKLILSGATATVVQSREVSTSGGTTTPSDTVRYAAQRSGDKLVLKSQADGSVVGTMIVDGAIAPDLYLHWSTTVVGQRGSRAATLTYIKHA